MESHRRHNEDQAEKQRQRRDPAERSATSLNRRPGHQEEGQDQQEVWASYDTAAEEEAGPEEKARGVVLDRLPEYPHSPGEKEGEESDRQNFTFEEYAKRVEGNDPGRHRRRHPAEPPLRQQKDRDDRCQPEKKLRPDHHRLVMSGEEVERREKIGVERGTEEARRPPAGENLHRQAIVGQGVDDRETEKRLPHQIEKIPEAQEEARPQRRQEPPHPEPVPQVPFPID